MSLESRVCRIRESHRCTDRRLSAAKGRAGPYGTACSTSRRTSVQSHVPCPSPAARDFVASWREHVPRAAGTQPTDRTKPPWAAGRPTKLGNGTSDVGKSACARASTNAPLASSTTPHQEPIRSRWTASPANRRPASPGPSNTQTVGRAITCHLVASERSSRLEPLATSGMSGRLEPVATKTRGRVSAPDLTIRKRTRSPGTKEGTPDSPTRTGEQESNATPSESEANVGPSAWISARTAGSTSRRTWNGRSRATRCWTAPGADIRGVRRPASLIWLLLSVASFNSRIISSAQSGSGIRSSRGNPLAGRAVLSHGPLSPTGGSG
jgi:hypothetical protein